MSDKANKSDSRETGASSLNDVYRDSGVHIPVSPEALLPVLLELLGEGRDVPITVTGYSMRPFLEHRRDSAVIAPPSRPPQRGDIVLLRRSNGAYVLHRVLRTDGDTVLTVGDSNARADAPSDISDVAGIVTAVYRQGKLIRPDSRVWRFYSRVWGVHPRLRAPFRIVYRIFRDNTMKDVT